MNEYFTLASRDGIAQLQLNRPEQLNAMGPGFFPALREALRVLHDDASVRVLVVSSTGAHFGSGLAAEVFEDVLPQRAAAPAQDRRDPSRSAQREAVGALLQMLGGTPASARPGLDGAVRRLVDSFDALEAARFPVLCVVQGACLGGALDLAAACDLRVCSADAFFGMQEAPVNLTADPRVLQRLPALVGPAIAREMAYTGGRLDAARALQVGLVNAVLADADAALDHALALARQIAAQPPQAVASCKRLLNQAREAAPPAPRVPVVDQAAMAAALSAWRARGASVDPSARR